jgi:hypothetical protein
MSNGIERTAKDASRVVNAFSENATEDPIQPIVDLQSGERQVQASAAVVKVGDRLLGAILDLFG